MSGSADIQPSHPQAPQAGLIDVRMDSDRLRPILVVEDDPNDLELTLAALAKCQISNEIVIARDGVEALDYLHRRGRWAMRDAGQPAVVLLDLKLPKINGLEVLAEIKTTWLLKGVPVVMLTSSMVKDDLRQAYEKGVNAFVVKPIGLGEFFKAVQDLGVFWGAVNRSP